MFCHNTLTVSFRSHFYPYKIFCFLWPSPENKILNTVCSRLGHVGEWITGPVRVTCPASHAVVQLFRTPQHIRENMRLWVTQIQRENYWFSLLRKQFSTQKFHKKKTHFFVVVLTLVKTQQTNLGHSLPNTSWWNNSSPDNSVPSTVRHHATTFWSTMATYTKMVPSGYNRAETSYCLGAVAASQCSTSLMFVVMLV